MEGEDRRTPGNMAQLAWDINQKNNKDPVSKKVEERTDLKSVL